MKKAATERVNDPDAAIGRFVNRPIKTAATSGWITNRSSGTTIAEFSLAVTGDQCEKLAGGILRMKKSRNREGIDVTGCGP